MFYHRAVTFAPMGPAGRKFINTVSEIKIMNGFFFGENVKWEFIYVKPSLSAEACDSSSVLLRVLWGQQPAYVTGVTLCASQQGPEEQDSRPKTTRTSDSSYDSGSVCTNKVFLSPPFALSLSLSIFLFFLFLFLSLSVSLS